MKCYFPSHVLHTLYATLLSPYLNDGILAWGNCSKVNIDNIFIIQKKINIVGDQPVVPVTNLWEQRFESVFVFPDEYRTILTWAAPLEIPGIFVRGQQRSHRDRNSNSSNRGNMHIKLLGWS